MNDKLGQLKAELKTAFPGNERICLEPNNYILERLKKADISIDNINCIEWRPDEDSIGITYMVKRPL